MREHASFAAPRFIQEGFYLILRVKGDLFLDHISLSSIEQLDGDRK